MPNRKLISKLSIQIFQDVSYTVESLQNKYVLKLRTKKTERGEPLEFSQRCTPRGFRTTFDQLIVTLAIGAVGENVKKNASPKTVCPTPPKAATSVSTVYTPNSARIVFTASSQAVTNWRTGEELPAGAGSKNNHGIKF